MMKIAGVVVAVVVFAMLSAVGYLTQVGFSQTFGPSDPSAEGNFPQRHLHRSNVSPSNSYGEDEPGPEPIPEGESVWEDYDAKDLDNEKRLPDRPGNFEVIAKVGEFWEAMYQIDPDYNDVAYPLCWNHEWYQTKEEQDADEAADEAKYRKSGRKHKNKLRQFNVVMHKLTFLNLKEGESGIPNFADRGLTEVEVDEFAEVRKKHPERCVVVLIRAGLESLQSNKIEGDNSDADFALCWVKKKDNGWKLVWMSR
ncbi:MAG: hypothetical protein KDB82_02770 [Planctomycetes bacterium]|nr:hypothetical protein [Planctomycetota bacterium]